MSIELLREYANLGFPFVLLLLCALGMRAGWASIWPRIEKERDHQEERSRAREKRMEDQSEAFLSTIHIFQNGMTSSLAKIVDILTKMQLTQTADKQEIMEAIERSENAKKR